MFLPTDENLLFLSIFFPIRPPRCVLNCGPKNTFIKPALTAFENNWPPPLRGNLTASSSSPSSPPTFRIHHSSYIFTRVTVKFRSHVPNWITLILKGSCSPPCGWFIAVCCEMRSAVSVFVCVCQVGGWPNVFLFKTISLPRKTKTRDSFIKTHRALLASKSNNPLYVGTEPIIADYNCCQALKVNWPAIFPRSSQLIAKQNAPRSPSLPFRVFDLSMRLNYFHSPLLFTFHTPLHEVLISFLPLSPHFPLLSISVRLSLWGHGEGNRDIWASGKQMWAFESKRRAAKEIKDLETLSLLLPSHTQQRGVTLLRFLRRYARESGWCCHMVVMKSSRTLVLWKGCHEKFLGSHFFLTLLKNTAGGKPSMWSIGVILK